jgi:hypothetical protein
MHTLHYLNEAFGQQDQEAQPQQPPGGGMPPGQEQPPGEEAPQEQGISPEETQEIEFDSLKKYIIYTKIREMKDKLEDSDIVANEKYKDVLYFLNIILNFFDIFEYDQLVGMVDNVVARIEKMESSADKKSKFRF